MNILVVNGFGNNPKGMKKFDQFLKSIKKILKAISSRTGIGNIEYIIRDYSNLDEYICNQDTHIIDIKSKKVKCLLKLAF